VRCWGLLVADAVRLRRRRGAPDVVLVGYLGHFDVVLARILYPRATIVLDHLVFAGDTAADRGARGMRVRFLSALDRVATSCADIVVVDTDEHRSMLRDPSRATVVAVGAPDAWFTAGDLREPHDAPRPGAPQGQDGQPLSAVFFGLFTPLQGVGVLAEALSRALPDTRGSGIRVTMVGSGQEYAAARRTLATTPGVTWVDWVDPAELPDLVASHDVCLGIFSTTPKGVRVVPNKVFQGLAAGCVVVTSDTPPQRRALGDHLELVPPADPDALADRLVALTEPGALAAARRRARSARPVIQPSAVVTPLVEALARRSAR
jgi:glycosyltransferase involved in cell wall biosynthesis